MIPHWEAGTWGQSHSSGSEAATYDNGMWSSEYLFVTLAALLLTQLQLLLTCFEKQQKMAQVLDPWIWPGPAWLLQVFGAETVNGWSLLFFFSHPYCHFLPPSLLPSLPPSFPPTPHLMFSFSFSLYHFAFQINKINIENKEKITSVWFSINCLWHTGILSCSTIKHSRSCFAIHINCIQNQCKKYWKVINRHINKIIINYSPLYKS